MSLEFGFKLGDLGSNGGDNILPGLETARLCGFVGQVGVHVHATQSGGKIGLVAGSVGFAILILLVGQAEEFSIPIPFQEYIELLREAIPLAGSSPVTCSR